jgi:hypothetical protein
MKQPLEAVKYIFVLHKLTTVGLLNAFLYTCYEASLFLEHPGNSVFNELLGVLAIGKGHLLKPRFNVGREMYFHDFKVREKPAARQHGRVQQHLSSKFSLGRKLATATWRLAMASAHPAPDVAAGNTL